MKEKVPYVDRMKCAEAVLRGNTTTREVAEERRVSQSTVAGWCKKFAKKRFKVDRQKGQRWYGALARANGEKVAMPTRATSVSNITTTTTKGGEWSITIGGYRLTLDKEPGLVLLERI